MIEIICMPTGKISPFCPNMNNLINFNDLETCLAKLNVDVDFV